jgi:hypothetical protein
MILAERKNKEGKVGVIRWTDCPLQKYKVIKKSLYTWRLQYKPSRARRLFITLYKSINMQKTHTGRTAIRYFTVALNKYINPRRPTYERPKVYKTIFFFK